MRAGGAAVAAAVALLLIACAPGNDASAPATPATGPAVSDADLARSGGAVTVDDDSGDAFNRSAPALSVGDRRAFVVGNNFFNDNWVTAPASTDGRDGLGPLFNAQSCSSCHFKDGRAQPPTGGGRPELGLLLRLSVPGPDGRPQPAPVYGDQLQDRSVNGVPAEGTIVITTEDRPGRFADGTPYTLARPSYSIGDPAYGPLPPDLMVSPRIASPVFGAGLLEAVPEAAVVAAADPDDGDGDGISGRPNRVPDARTGQPALGRFGWKANIATVEAQVASAFHADIGIGSTVRPGDPCSAEQEACRRAPNGGAPEVDDDKLGRVVFYNRTLAVPARRGVADPERRAGADRFARLGCTACHTAEVRTGTSDIAALSNQTIRPYTDLLVHDMGEGLADGRPDALADGREWRTAPLWGIGLTRTVNRHTRFLHDGRARSLEEAVLWHGGEAEGAQRRYLALSADERRSVLAFLESL
jgi:CxxC motif-containing protein (DUF1111 family)